MSTKPGQAQSFDNGWRTMYYDAVGHMTTLGSVTSSSYTAPQDVNPLTVTMESFTFVLTQAALTWVDGCKYDALGRRIRACGSMPMAYDGDRVVRVNGTRIVYGASLDEPLVVYDSLLSGETVHRLHYFLTDGGGLLLSYTDSAGYDQRANISGNHVYTDRAIFAGAIANGRTFGASARQATSTPELGFFRNRYYDQRTGRWTQEDPIGPAGGVNLYAYVGNNPVTFQDPFGLCPVEKDGIPCTVYSLNNADLSKLQPGTMATLQDIANTAGHDLGVGFATEGTHTDPCHAQGCAVDIDEIDHVRVGSYGDRNTAAGSLVSDVEAAARNNPSVHQVITPNGNWASNRRGGEKHQLPLVDRPEKKQFLWSEHQSHLHVSVYPD